MSSASELPEREIDLIWGEIERDDLIWGEEMRAGFEASNVAEKKNVARKTNAAGVGITREREIDIYGRQTEKRGKTKPYISYNLLRRPVFVLRCQSFFIIIKIIKK